MEPREYTIQELSDLSGVPRRTVHFYTQQGILPPPQGAGLGARYSELHLLRLQAVPVLRAHGLRLDEIRRRLAGLDLEATQALLAQAPSPAAARAIGEGTPAWPAGPSIGRPDHPASPELSIPTPHTTLHYPLPGGLELTAPADLDPALRRKLLRLLQEARRILSADD
jgi:DNA-binding transcriptional MerR regulator